MFHPFTLIHPCSVGGGIVFLGFLMQFLNSVICIFIRLFNVIVQKILDVTDFSLELNGLPMCK